MLPLRAPDKSEHSCRLFGENPMWPLRIPTRKPFLESTNNTLHQLSMAKMLVDAESSRVLTDCQVQNAFLADSLDSKKERTQTNKLPSFWKTPCHIVNNWANLCSTSSPSPPTYLPTCGRTSTEVSVVSAYMRTEGSYAVRLLEENHQSTP